MEDLSPETIQALKGAFSMLDADDNGAVSHEEVADLLERLGFNVSEDEVMDMIQEVDTDGNGTIEFDEFVECVRPALTAKPVEKTSQPNEGMMAAFKEFDEDGNGFIEPEELRTKMSEMSGCEIPMEQIQDMIKQVDVNGDGKVDYEEFVKLMSL